MLESSRAEEKASVGTMRVNMPLADRVTMLVRVLMLRVELDRAIVVRGVVDEQKFSRSNDLFNFLLHSTLQHSLFFQFTVKFSLFLCNENSDL